jgi:uncharacterized membrane protein YedE/YeeE
MELVLGLLTGIVFGFLLQKAEVLRFEKQVGFMLFRDMTIIKFMFSAVLVGMVGLYLLNALGMISFSIKAANLGAIAVGGSLFGVGWAVAGYCPGTSVGAIAEGRIHAIWAVLGMICGAAFYAEAYPFLLETVLAWKDLGKITLPQLLGVSPWGIIALFLGFGMVLFTWFEKNNL